MTIPVRLFAGLKEQLGRERAELDLPPGAVARELKAAMAEAYPELASMLASVRVAVDQVFVGPDHVIPPGAEIALIPPVSGG